MKTASTNKKVRELIGLVREEKLIPRPEFQRRLVWTIADKNHYIDSLIREYPFPEIYVADGNVNLDTGEGTQLLVDGLQRVSTLVQYFEGDLDLKLVSVPAYKDLAPEQKQAFLQYDVSVRDLGALSREEIIEVFRRLNATKYALTDIEVNNAVYSGALRQFCEKIALLPFFLDHKVFTSLDYKRMGDLRFALLITATLIGGYFNRDDEFEAFLDRYNDELPNSDQLNDMIVSALDFIDECGFVPTSRAWRKADLFTLIIEIILRRNIRGEDLDPLTVVNSVQNFFDSIKGDLSDQSISGIYYKATLQASNDRINRVRRGMIIGGIMREVPPEEIRQRLVSSGLAQEAGLEKSPQITAEPLEPE